MRICGITPRLYPGDLDDEEGWENSWDLSARRKLTLKISEKLKTSAKNNTVKDFEFSYFDDIDNALIEGLSQNKDSFTRLLSDEDIKKQVLGIFTEEI